MGEMRTPLRGIGPPGDNEIFDLTTGDNHRYAMWDAAYVLGSLSAADRREFEAHMENCPGCREAAADLSGMPALLSQLSREEVAAINESGRTPSATPEMSPELSPSLLATVRGRRRRTRVATWVASSAAAVVLAIGVFVWCSGVFLDTCVWAAPTSGLIQGPIRPAIDSEVQRCFTLLQPHSDWRPAARTTPRSATLFFPGIETGTNWRVAVDCPAQGGD
jgi:Putative zinc-finger